MAETNNTNLKNAVVDIAKSLEAVFRKYSRNTRGKAWGRITGKQGEIQIKKILQDPTRPTNGFQKLATQAESFSTWMEKRSIR
jgi:hypothetical protein